jgi:hypothetical protein
VKLLFNFDMFHDVSNMTAASNARTWEPCLASAAANTPVIRGP